MVTFCVVFTWGQDFESKIAINLVVLSNYLDWFPVSMVSNLTSILVHSTQHTKTHWDAKEETKNENGRNIYKRVEIFSKYIS